jgi:hypothetical protein
MTVTAHNQTNSFFPIFKSKFLDNSSGLKFRDTENLGEHAFTEIFSSNEDYQSALNETFRQLTNISLSDIEVSDKEKPLYYYFYVRFLNTLFDYIKKDKLSSEVVRMSSPPLEAYNYVGHNKLDVKESSQSYALTFED